MEYLAHILVMAGIYVILTMSLNLVVGYAGLPAMGHSAFFCAGAYVSSLLALNAGVSPWLGILGAAIVAAVFGWIVGLSAVRLAGDFLALATFAFAVVTHSVARNWIDLTRGPMGLPGIPPFRFFGLPLDTAWGFLPLVTVVCCLMFFLSKRLVESPFGRILQGIREDETVTASLGKNVPRYKRSVFVVGALLAGIAGTLYAHYITYIDPSSFTPMESFAILLMVVFGGMGSLAGSLVGATLLVFLPELLRFMGLPSTVAAPLRQMTYGALLVALMLVRPQGLLGKFKWR
ncbi:MAG: branched-chain amino acid ABC transporter permease [Candidatus Hydrogenedentes bacterium]|nr:branched-chain amino acid ABC transporter permease [Candidatus Hydrogenedentota bacterium]